MYTSSVRAVLLLIAFSILLLSCDTSDPFRIPPPDFSTVPEAYNIENVEPVTIEEGVDVYHLEEGFGPFFVTVRDEVAVFMTLRTDEGEVIFSTFANGNELAIPLSVRSSGTIQNVFQYSILLSYTPGLKAGILGMQQGEKRTIVVSPEKGFGTASSTNTNSEYSENTLIYDITVSSINPG